MEHCRHGLRFDAPPDSASTRSSATPRHGPAPSLPSPHRSSRVGPPQPRRSHTGPRPFLSFLRSSSIVLLITFLSTALSVFTAASPMTIYGRCLPFLARARSAPSHATGRVPRPPRVPESLAHCCTFQSLLLSAAPVRRRQVPLPARRHRPSRSSASLASCQDQRRPLLPAAARPCPDDQQLELPPRTSCDLPRQGLDKSLDAPPDVSMPLFDPCTTTR